MAWTNKKGGLTIPSLRCQVMLAAGFDFGDEHLTVTFSPVSVRPASISGDVSGGTEEKYGKNKVASHIMKTNLYYKLICVCVCVSVSNLGNWI